MSMQAISANANSIVAQQKPQLPPVGAHVEGPQVYNTADGKRIEVMGNALGKYTIQVTDTNSMSPKTEIKTVTREELQALISDEKKHPGLINFEPRTFNSQEAGRTEGVGENLSLIA